MPVYPPLPDDRQVYIILRNAAYQDADSGAILPSAFELRQAELKEGRAHDGDGVSLLLCDHPPLTSELKTLLPGLKSKVCGVDRLRVGDIRRLGLEVIQDSPHHAYIQGLPYRYSGVAGDEETAITLAGVSPCFPSR